MISTSIGRLNGEGWTDTDLLPTFWATGSALMGILLDDLVS